MHPLAQALHELASRCDGAGTEDGQGFNKADSYFGKSMAKISIEQWSPKQKRAIWRMLQKYKGQLAGYGIDYDAIPEPSANGKPPAQGESRSLKYMCLKDGNILVEFDPSLEDHFFRPAA